MHLQVHLQVEVRRSTCEKRPSFKLQSIFSARIQAFTDLISY
jgi:hypothetical protein